jgi:hypothetical protein
MNFLLPLLPLLPLLTAGCVTTGGTTSDDYCAYLFPRGTEGYGRCYMEQDAQTRAMGMEGLRMLYGQAARGYRY